MSHSIFRLIEAAALRQNPVAIPLLQSSQDLRMLVAAWPLAAPPIATPPPEPDASNLDGATLSELAQRCWSACPIEYPVVVQDLRQILGPAFPVRARLDQAIAAALVFPGGAASSTASQFIALKNAQILKRTKGD